MKLKKRCLPAAGKLMGKPEFSTCVIFIIMLVLTAFLQNGFFTLRVMHSYINSFTPLILLAMGQAVVILAGGLDLSCGSAMALMLCIMTQVMNPEAPASGIAAILLALAMALVIGLVNGIAVGWLCLPPVIATFATSYIWLGLALFITPTPGGSITPWFKVFYDPRAFADAPGWMQKAGGIVPPALLLIALGCAVWFVIKRTKTGRYIYAVGSHRDNAYDSGINAAKVQTVSYILGAFFAFLCALFFAAQNGAGSANIGEPMTLQAIAAAIVGGIAMSGGKGNVYMAIVGALIMSFVGKIIYFANVPNAYQTLVSGLIIILAIASSAVYAGRQKKTQLKGGEGNG